MSAPNGGRPPKRIRMNSDEEQNETDEQDKARRAAKAAYDKKRRTNASNEKKRALAEQKREERLKIKDTAANLQRQNESERKRRRWSNMTEQEKIEQRSNNAESQRRLQNKRANEQLEQMKTLKGIAEGAVENESNIKEDYCGSMNEKCIACKANHFNDEKFEYYAIENAIGDKIKQKIYSQCCQKGQVDLTFLYKKQEHKEYPDVLKQLLKKEDDIGINLMENIRSVNSSFGYASTGANISPPPGFGPYCFRIHGQIYHRTGTLHPLEGEPRQYAQLYILDTNEANCERMRHVANKNVNPAVFNIIADFMQNNNALAKSYRMLYEVEKESMKEANGNETKVTMAIISDGNYDKRRYNAATADEVAVVFQNKDGEPPLERDLLMHLRPQPGDQNKGVKRIEILNMHLDAMTYPVLFPYGQRSWGIDLKKNSKKGAKRLTLMDYYSYILSTRDEFNPFLNAGKLTQQYFVDSYVKMEANRLSYIENNQSEWRGDTLKGFQDFVASEAELKGKKPGRVVILPSSFQGSPRFMTQNYQDSMAIVTKYGKPDLFVTITCNPKWKEIQENLEPWQSAEHRPDLVARVFNMKLEKILKDITKKVGIFGIVVAFVYVIEFQKRGLPHAHLLLILDKDSKLDTPEKIDNVVRAEIPDQQTSPRLFEIVTNNMVHGPCGKGIKSPCMSGDKCSKKFPKDFQEKTKGNENVSDGYAMYRRRPGKEIIVKGRSIDNRWIVPYNPFLLLKYNCHINVEVCASIKCVKYLFKYVYKGHDCANVEIKETNIISHDEVKKHVDSRYISAPEAAWRIFGHSMHGHSHSIERLAVHLPGEEYVVIKAGDSSNASPSTSDLEKKVQKAEKKHTTLTAWFELNKVNEEARDLYYWQIPLTYTWLKSKGIWKVRQGSFNKIARMYTVTPKDAERFYLRLLLLHVKGARSFEDLLSFEGASYDTFRESAKARGLLADDNVWQRTIDDAIACHMPKQLRQIFAYICCYCNPSDPKKLWNDNLADLTEDICYKLHQSIGECGNCAFYALKQLQQFLILLGSSLDQLGLPQPPTNLPDIESDGIDIQFEQAEATRMIETLNYEQRLAFESVMLAINDETHRSKCFFLDGPGGSGKTYLYTTILHYLKGKELTVLPTASTGIAANLLSGGRTFHSLFKLGIPITEKTVSGIKPHSVVADLIRNSALIIVDECTMASSHAMDAIDRFLREVMEILGGKEIPFGGKVILLGGDFRQCLAIVPHAQRPAIVQGSLKYCTAWNVFNILPLKNNVRSVDPEYSDWLLKVGDGTLRNEHGLGNDIIEIPKKMVCTECIVTEIYGNQIKFEDVKAMSKRAILCPKNSNVDKINEKILSKIEGDERVYLSIDKIDAEGNDGTDFPVEFVNSLTPSGMPPHILKLKIGAVIMLLRNLNTKEGLCNGTRLYVTGLQNNLIKAEVLTGSAEGKEVLIPRIDLSPTDTGLPFKLTRRQFPIRVAFAMTINKSQGQTLDKVGIYLPEPVFGHGQLYVAFSRVRRSNDVRVKVEDTSEQGKLLENSDAVFTRNVVYHEIF